METSQGKLAWWQLTLFGVGCTIGTGFFLGSSIAIQKSGFWILLIFILAAFATLFVYEALAQMTVLHPQKGSFRTYAKQAYGPSAGFSVGWVYWCSEMLIMGSTLTALGIFTQFWLPGFPLWMLAAGYAVLALLVVILGSSGINKVENLLAIVKIAAVVMFILVAGYAFLQGTGGVKPIRHSAAEWFDSGWLGAWKGILYAFYAFGGIEVMGFMAVDLRDPKEAPKAGRVMLLAITVLYVFSIGLALLFVTKEGVTPDKSLLIAALEVMGLPYLVYVLGGVLVIAGFSILVASLYAISTMLMALAEDGDAPEWMANTWGKRKLPLYALGVNTLGLCVSILLALLMPKQIFEHITTAAGLVILYTWLFILASYLKLIKPEAGGQVKSWIAILLIASAVTGPLLEETGRPGFWSSLLIVLAIGLVAAWRLYKGNKTIKDPA
ncbi:L-asparagine transporter [Paenibacillus sp. 1_12]|uniref:amino acid permease n=1 Tax=Paenibacillus sp. 1_12 TaxID=1566278 RepID=UPI0008EB55ED|nr:amino acid permease [Paenibacillus sp. 1_12]SFM37132.1 L-asparagine transporter [Paenibacillus sp. 1_12]